MSRGFVHKGLSQVPCLTSDKHEQQAGKKRTCCYTHVCLHIPKIIISAYPLGSNEGPRSQILEALPTNWIKGQIREGSSSSST